MVSRELDLFEEKSGAVGLESRTELVRSPLPESLEPRCPTGTLDFTGEFKETLRGVVTIPLETILWLSSCRRSNFRNFRGDYPDLESL
jgi:hypothetical protein